MDREQIGASNIINGDNNQKLIEQRSKNFAMAINKRGEAEKLNIDEMIKELVADLPMELQKEIINAFDRLRGKGLKDDELIEEVLEIRRILKSAYEDARFGVENKPYAKLQTIKMIAELFNEDDVDINSLKRVARISFDLNGLKAVNDLTGSHEQGDQYLKMMIDVLRGEKTTVWLTEHKIEVIITADGGDEFGMILRSSEAINEELVYNELISGIIKTELWNDEEAKNILDFNKEEVLLAYAGVDKNEWLVKTAIEKNETLSDIKKKIPSAYFFRAAVSAGITTLFNSFTHAKIEDSDSYERLLEKAMGSLFDLSDKEMQTDKTSFKTNLKNSQDIRENFLLKVYSRTDSEKKLRDIIDRYERFLRDLKQFAPALEVPSLSKFIEDFEKNVNTD